MPGQVRISLGARQARCLLQLAEEADFETFESMGDTRVEVRRNQAAARKALQVLEAAVTEAERSRADGGGT